MKDYIVAKEAEYRYPRGGFFLQTFSLTLRTGEIVLIKGANGSGKSTLCKLLAGILKPQSGSVMIDACPTTELSLGQIGMKIGYLWQKPELQLFAPTALEDLVFTEVIKGMSTKEAVRKAEYWLEYFQIQSLKRADIFTLSGGEKQRLALAAVLSQGAKFLILDEPSKSLDRQNKERLINLLQKLKFEEQVGMAIISHDEELTEQLAEKVILMQDGQCKITDVR